MIDFEQLGRDLWSVRFSLDVASNNLVGDDQISDEATEEHLEVLDVASAQLKAICDALAKASGAFCNGFVSADRKALADGRKWSEERAEKIALLRLAGDDTPEEQIPL